MDKRLQEVERLRAVFKPEPNYPRLIVLIDEGAQISPAYATQDKDKEMRKMAMHLLSEIARIGREPRVNVIHGTQRPDDHTLPVSIRGQLEGVCCFRTENELDSKIVLRHEGAENLPWVPGRFLYKSPLVKHDIEVQSPYVPPKVLKQIIEPLIRYNADHNDTPPHDVMCKDKEATVSGVDTCSDNTEKISDWGV